MAKRSRAEAFRLVHERALYRCEYCQSPQRGMGQAMHVDHIDPDGGDDLNNLCLSCANCNMSKAPATSAVDPESDVNVPLFNPRLQDWAVHFEWHKDGTIVNGRTATGRATITRFRMNRDRNVEARKIWVLAGIHPPT